MTNEERIAELETALENLLENFEEVSTQKFSGIKYEYLIEVETYNDDSEAVMIVSGAVNATCSEAIRFAQEVLYDEGYEFDSEDEG